MLQFYAQPGKIKTSSLVSLQKCGLLFKEKGSVLFYKSIYRSSVITDNDQSQSNVWSVIICVLRWLMRPILAADSTRKVWGRKLCWWCLSSGFPLRTFPLGFADSFYFVYTSIPSYEASPLCSILCNLFHDFVGMLKSLREALRVSLYRFFWLPWERFLTCSSP